MGEVIKLKAKQAPVFTDMTDMLNQWWKAQSRKPLAKPMKIRHVVETAHSAGWSLEECYEALSITWGFSESAFETALRRVKDEQEETQRPISSIATVAATNQLLESNKEKSLSLKENAKRMRELKQQLRPQG